MGAAVGTGLTICHGPGCNVPPESSLDTILPGVDALISEVKSTDEIDYLVDRHTIAEDAGDELRIVPELRIELLIQSGDRSAQSTLIGELEVVVLGSIRFVDLDDLTLSDTLGDIEPLVLVINTGSFSTAAFSISFGAASSAAASAASTVALSSTASSSSGL